MIIGQQLDVVRYGDDVAKTLARLFASTRDDLEARIQNAAERGSEFTEDHLRAMRGQIDGNLVLLAQHTADVIDDAALAVAEDGYAEAAQVFAQKRSAAGLEPSGSVVFGNEQFLPTKSLVELARGPIGGRPLSEWTAAIFNKKELDGIQRELFTAVASGSGAEGAARALRKKLGVSRNRADIIARTTLLDVNNRATKEVYKQNADVILKFRWLGTLDSRTCPRCGALDGRVENKYEDFKQGAPPIHPRCRCIISPVTQFDSEPAQRPAVVESEEKVTQHRDGTTSTKHRPTKTKMVDGGVSFPEFFKSQPAAWQRRYLGDEKYQLMTAGDLSFSDLTSSDDSRILSIKDLKAKIARRTGSVPTTTRSRRIAPKPSISAPPKPKPKPLSPAEQQARLVARAKQADTKNALKIVSSYTAAEREKLTQGLGESVDKIARVRERQEKLADRAGNAAKDILALRLQLREANAAGSLAEVRALEDQLREATTRGAKVQQQWKTSEAALSKLLKEREKEAAEFARRFAVGGNQTPTKTKIAVTLGKGAKRGREAAFVKLAAEHRPKIEKGLERFNQLTSHLKPSDVSGGRVAAGTQVDIFISPKKVRAYHSRSRLHGQKDREWFNVEHDNPIVVLDKSNNPSAVAHEMGHHLEDILPKGTKRSLEFQQILKLRGGARGHEIRQNNEYVMTVWNAAYEQYAATEVLSVGLETLAEDPIGFARRDPEYFDFMVATLRGWI